VLGNASKAPNAIEYLAATSGVGLVEASERGRLRLRGAEHLEFLQRLSTNDTLGCEVEAGLRTIFCDPRGRIVEVVELCRVSTDLTAGFVPPGRTTSLIDWLERYRFSELIEYFDDSGDSQQLEIIGPQAEKMCADVLSIEAARVPAFSLLPHETLLAMRIDGGGHPGIRLWGTDLSSCRQDLTAAGAVLVGEETVEQLRVEWGVPGTAELTLEHNPWEAGLGDAIHTGKGCYTGQEVIARLDTYQKVKQHLVGLRLQGPVPAGATIMVADSKVGVVTSVTQSAASGHLALGYIRTAHCRAGVSVVIDGDNMSAPSQAIVSDLPFSRQR